MLSNDDHPGLFAFMVGVIVVVMAAVGLSVLMDRKFSFSIETKAMEKVIVSDQEQIELLQAHIRESSRKLPAIKPGELTPNELLESIRRRLKVGEKRLASLQESRRELLVAIPSIGLDFSNYREKYIERIRARAAGESLGNLILRNGREYRQVVISHVTDVGLEIRHADGIARIQAPDLDQTLQDRFQWSEEERRARLAEGISSGETVNSKPDPGQVRGSLGQVSGRRDRDAKAESGYRRVPSWERPEGAGGQTGSASKPDPAVIADRRKRVLGMRSKVSLLSSELERARSASYGSSTSVPGSLETWQSKAERLSADLMRAKAGLAAAKASLGMVSPDDPLVQPEPALD